MAMESNVTMEPKPPDGKDSSLSPKASFRDKLIGGNASNMHQERVDLIGNRRNNQSRGKGKTRLKDHSGNPSINNQGSTSQKASDLVNEGSGLSSKSSQENEANRLRFTDEDRHLDSISLPSKDNVSMSEEISKVKVDSDVHNKETNVQNPS
ncbi:RhoGAP domain containing protein [Sesbania bispinosa]|nr:RhoGAP domain containing protein [Sesbania bispinosa]